ncbi:MAG TPA: lysophospholipid acyltransferase family protein [Candidatus Acidoferrales bacterium]|nr:lysophospholipid acyltransferase family protein [Candidatus Acidoferrales bacterium]
MIRTLFVYAFLGLGVVLVLPWFVLGTVITGNPDSMYYMAMSACAFALRTIGVRVHIEGIENIPPGVCVFASNHASNLDPMVYFPAIPRRISVLIKKELLKVPILSAGMRAAKFVAVDRGDPEAAAASVDEAVRYIHGGLSFAVFAEGTRSPDGRMRPFKKGAVLMAIQAGVPLVPVSIAGTQHLMRKGSRRINAGDVTVRFDPPIDASQFSIERRNELLAQLESAVAAGLPADQRPILQPPARESP